MDRRMSNDATHTGSLPAAGTDAVPVTGEPPARPSEPPEWLAERRAELTDPGRYLAYEESGRRLVVALGAEGTRIGRSLSAEIRFDDATVSRRHALVVSYEAGARVLDDRSLNGVYLNGRRIETAPLADGDEIVVGRHAIYFLDTAGVGSEGARTPVAFAE